MVITIERKVIRFRSFVGIKCPKSWNGYTVRVTIHPKGLWKGIKYKQIKYRGKAERVFNLKNASKYSKRLITVDGHVGTIGPFDANRTIQFARLPNRYHKYIGRRAHVAIAPTIVCKKCGTLN